MAKIIQFEEVKEDVELAYGEWSDDLKKMEKWVHYTANYLTHIASGRYTKVDMLNCMYLLTGLQYSTERVRISGEAVHRRDARLRLEGFVDDKVKGESQCQSK